MKIKEELGGKALMTENEYNNKMKELDFELARLARSRSGATMERGKLSKGKRSHTYKRGPKRGKTEYVLKDRVKESLVLTAGDVSGVGLGIERHGVFQEYGVSNGHPITGKLRAKNDWLSASLEEVEPKVAEVAAEYAADRVVKVLSLQFRR